MADTGDPGNGHRDIDELLAAFDAGELDPEPISAAQRDAMASAARLVPKAWDGPEPPPGLRGRVLERIRLDAEQQAAPSTARVHARRRGWMTARPALAALAVAAAVLVLALTLTGAKNAASPKLFDAELAVVHGGPSPRASGGTEIHTGRYGYEVKLDAEGLAPTTGSQYYELWYVGKGDSRAAPNRVPVGTFRPIDGSVHTWFPAAFDGMRFNRVSITLQPGTGNPSRVGPEVLVGPSLPVGRESKP
jgi:hypothetical protein